MECQYVHPLALVEPGGWHCAVVMVLAAMLLWLVPAARVLVVRACMRRECAALCNAHCAASCNWNGASDKHVGKRAMPQAMARAEPGEERGAHCGVESRRTREKENAWNRNLNLGTCDACAVARAVGPRVSGTL